MRVLNCHLCNNKVDDTESDVTSETFSIAILLTDVKKLKTFEKNPKKQVTHVETIFIVFWNWHDVNSLRTLKTS